MVLGVTSFVLQFCDVFLVVAAFSLFMKRIGASNLPQIYVILNFISILMQLVMLSRKKVSTFDLVIKMTLLLLLVVIAGVFFVDSAYTIFFFALFIVVRMHDILCLTYFITYIQSVFPVRVAKANISRILGFSSVATILGGFSVKPLVTLLSFQTLFVVGAILLILLLFMIAFCARLWPPTVSSGSAKCSESAKSEDGASGFSRLVNSFKVLSNSKLAKNIVFVWFFFTFMRYLIDFQFSRSAAAIFESEADLAGFFGIFQSSLAMMTAFGQFTFSARLLSFCKLGGAMCLGPLLQLLLCLVLCFWSWPWLIIGLQALWTLGFHITSRPAFSILLVPLETSARDRVSLLSSMAAALGSLCSGVFLLIFQHSLAFSTYFALLAVLNGFFVLVALRLDGDYIQSVEERVNSADAGTKIEALEALGYLGQGRDLEQLTRLLNDTSAQVRLQAVNRITVLPIEQAEPLVRSLLDKEEDGRVLATLAKSLGDILGQRTLPLLCELVSSTKDLRVRANAIEALGDLGGEAEVELLQSYLNSGNHRIRANTVVALMKLSQRRSVLSNALERLVQMLRSKEPTMRAAAFASVGRMNITSLSNCLFVGLHDKEVSVRSNAIRSLSRLRPAEALGKLQQVAKGDPSKDVQKEAKRVCRLIEKQKVDDLVRLASRLTLSQREQAAAILRHSQGSGKGRVLRKILASSVKPLPDELLRLCHLTDDDKLLQVVGNCFEEPLNLIPLLHFLDEKERGKDPKGIPFLALLGTTFPDGTIKKALTPYIHALLIMLASGKDFEEVQKGLIENIILWSAVLGSEQERNTLQKALEGAMSLDSHLSSLSLEALEDKLKPDVFELLVPYLENCNEEAALPNLIDEYELAELTQPVIEILTRRLKKEELSKIERAKPWAIANTSS